MSEAPAFKRIYIILLLGLLTGIGPFSIDMYLPAFPAIAKGLHTSVGIVTMSLSSFFIGISCGQLLYGPLLERYGRKPPLYLGLILYFLASIGCAMANSADAMIILRFFQALGACAGMVTARAIVRDLFEVKENAKIFSSLMLVVAVSPIIAPTLGGYVTAAFGWRYVFVVLIIISCLILVSTYYFLPESKKPDPDFSLKPVAIVKNFIGVMRHPQFACYGLTGSIAYAGLYAYVSGSPTVFMEIFHVSEKNYGLIFAFIAMGLIGSAQFNNLLLRKFSSEQIIKGALATQCVIGLAFAIFAFLGVYQLFLTIFLIFFFLCCQGCIFPNSSALCLAPFGHNAGTASALMGAIQMGIGAGAAAVMSIFHSRSQIPMATVMSGCSLVALAVFLTGRKLIFKQVARNAVQEEELEMISTL